MLDSYLMGRKAITNGPLQFEDSYNSKWAIRFEPTMTSTIFDGRRARIFGKCG